MIGACFPASLAFLSLTGSLLAGVLLGVPLEACLLGLFLSSSSLGAPPKSCRGSLWFVAFLLVRELDSVPDSTPGGGEGAGELLLDFLVAPPDLSCTELDSALDSTTCSSEGACELPLDFLVTPPDLSCTKARRAKSLSRLSEGSLSNSSFSRSLILGWLNSLTFGVDSTVGIPGFLVVMLV